MKQLSFLTLAALAACSPSPKAPTHGQVFSLVGATSTGPQGFRCILHSDSTLTVRVDSCAAVAVPISTLDTVVTTVKVSPNPVKLGIGQTFQLTGGAYNAAGQLIPGAGFWKSVDTSKVTVNTTGLVTAKALTPNTNVEFHYATKLSWAGINVVAPLVFIRPKPSSVDVADMPITLCAFVVMPDNSVAIGIDPKNTTPDATKSYCSAAPLTKFLAETTH